MKISCHWKNYHMHYSKWPPIATFILFKYEMSFVVIKIICLSHELFKLHAHLFLMPFYSPSLKLGSGTTHLFYMLGPFILKNVITNIFFIHSLYHRNSEWTMFFFKKKLVFICSYYLKDGNLNENMCT